jgi:hypothetical protein
LRTLYPNKYRISRKIQQIFITAKFPGGYSFEHQETPKRPSGPGAFKGSSIMRKLNLILAAIGFLAVLSTLVLADRPTTAPATMPADSVTGAWGFTVHIEDLLIDGVAILKQDDTKITGDVITGVATKGDEVTDGKITGREIQFTVDRIEEVGTFRSIYRGTVDGDKIRGTVEIGWIDVPDHAGTTKIDWIATRAKDGSPPPHGVR